MTFGTFFICVYLEPGDHATLVSRWTSEDPELSWLGASGGGAGAGGGVEQVLLQQGLSFRLFGTSWLATYNISQGTGIKFNGSSAQSTYA